ncbi:hypothetical protein KFK09_006795 [Dendrobium nobile]|uniref:Uncharacterized protein n=1 Tax=Dendrobium nobile TaxID=94219 RepID=A0A8T3BUK7_DENNO|nr:hypothetical protein KFK09_006795 [Dendrobium nobile]
MVESSMLGIGTSPTLFVPIFSLGGFEIESISWSHAGYGSCSSFCLFLLM